MVGPLVILPSSMASMASMEGEEEEGHRHRHHPHPRWLKPMLKADYFIPCEFHGDSNKCECNMFCLDCMGNALCSYCLVHHKDHHIVQIRRSSYHNVIRVNEVQRYIDISAVQTYIINSAKIVFLNERPQPRPGKGVTNTCEICCRSLLDSFRFCSLGCKLGGIKLGDSQLTFNLGDALDSNNKKIMKMTNTSDGSSISSGYAYTNMSPATHPIMNNTNSIRRRRRKGTPHRAPLK